MMTTAREVQSLLTSPISTKARAVFFRTKRCG